MVCCCAVLAVANCLEAEVSAGAAPSRPLFFDGPPPPDKIQEALHRGDIQSAIYMLEDVHMADQTNIFHVRII